jgi:hypothetical protein
VRAYSFFVVSALAAALTFGASSKRLEPEPSESQMESSFNQFFSKLATGAYSEIQFAAFKKHSCKPSTATSGHYCSFTYSTEMPAKGLSILPAHGTISGMFFTDDDGQLRFEMVTG